jgi:2-polyprenyl-6-methoxyphenol hydroxylase-like FAD-dependent oxidoreductase
VGAQERDIVIVGGGIAGASLACALAREGLSVTVLEASTEFEDKVRGESMQPWGVREARALGVEQIMLDAGAHMAPLWRQFVAGDTHARDIPVNIFVPEIGGTLNLRHPVACQALVDAAVVAGADVVRGVRDVAITGGASPSVAYRVGDTTDEIATALVIGADGRASTVRKQAGITLERQEPISYIAGLLIDDLEVPDDYDVLASGARFFVMFHQGGGRARVYICAGHSGRHDFAGREGTTRFLAACAKSAYPFAADVAAGTPVGPCATYPGDDTWTDAPYADGVVLIGDSAGHNDPIIGQGLSIALRDARIVRDLVLNGARTPEAFASYGKERFDRMATLRLIADMMAVSQAEDCDNRDARIAFVAERVAAMEPEVFALIAGLYAGPETVPPEHVDPTLLDRIRAA